VLKTTIAILLAGAFVSPCFAQTRPLTAAEKKIVTSSYGRNLKDPGAAQYRLPSLVIEPSVKGDEMGYCFQVNGKNSYGAYTGFRTIAGKVKRRNGSIVSFSYAAGSRDDAIMADTTAEICRIIGYSF